MSPQEFVKLRSISVDVQSARPIAKRRYRKNAQSEVIPRRTQLKIVRLDEQFITSPGSTSIINLQFGQDNIPLFKRACRKPSKRSYNIDDRKTSLMQRQLCKNRYHELFKDSVDYFCKNTMQIGPYSKPIPVQNELNDIYGKRKLINIEKITYPFREEKRSTSTRHKYKTLMNKTSRTVSKEDEEGHQRRNKSYVQKEADRYSKSPLKDNQIQPLLDNLLISNNEIKSEYKKQISTLIPIRKPNNKKDYFVFGMGDRNTTSDNKIELYRDLLWKINYSNSLYVCTPLNLPTPYKFYVGEGNNSNLIRGIMRRRFWWVQASNKNQQGLNFIWTQLKVNSFFTSQETALIPEYFIIQKFQERFQSESERVIKSKAFAQHQFDSNKKLFGRIDYKIWKSHFSKNQKSQQKINQSTYQKRVRMYQKKRIAKIEDSKYLRVHNHLEENFYIGNKKALFYNVKRYLELKGEDPFKMIPLTFHITKGIEDPEFSRFLKCYQSLEEQKSSKKSFRNIWIVKPGQNTNRGNGITVCYNLDDIKIRLKGKERNRDGKLRTFILQKYLQKPLLYNKRKFDLRHYILITCINGSFKGYWYEEGYVRTSSAEFNMKTSKDPAIHLTNDAIQKYVPQYGKYQKANKLSYAELEKYLENNVASKKSHFYDRILPKMKHFATETIKATYFILDNNRRKHNFQLLGLDFMIDEDFQPWLIEINTNPCLELCCPHLQRIIPSVIQNTFKLCIDPLFPPPENWPNNRKPFFGEDPVTQNKFQIIFDQTSDGKEIERLFSGKDKIDNNMGKIEEDEQTFQNEGEQWQKNE